MNIALRIAGIAALAALAWMCAEWALTWRATREVVATLPDLVSAEAELTRQAAVEEIRATRTEATEAIDRTSAKAVRSVEKMEAGAIGEVRRLRADLVTQSTLWRGMMDRQADTANGTLAGLRIDALPVLQNAAQVEANVNRTIDMLRPQALGALAASKVTAGNAAQITRDLKPAAPAAAKTLQNVEKLTRPAGWISKAVRFALKIIWPF